MKTRNSFPEPSPADQADLLVRLKSRFEAHPARHENLEWSAVLQRLEMYPEKLRSLAAMEGTSGEPDVVGRDKRTPEICFFDCSPETPRGRVALCYDREAFISRKADKPAGSALELAAEMGVELLSESQYYALQSLGEFDLKTSSWLLTPPPVRDLGGALFGDRRYGRAFVYHNGAQSYFGVRGFRACLKV